jgi:hypothetical protein
MRTWLSTIVLVLTAATSAAAQIPRAADGRPDLSGIWQVLGTAAWNLEDHSADRGVPAGQGVVEGGELPYLPEALEKRNENYRTRATSDPESKCYLPGIPRMMYMPFPFQIVQTPSHIAMAFEYVNAVRHIFLRGEHPEGPIDWWQGDARARWEGDTLVVDLVHFNGETWFDRAGNFHSDAMHLVERYTMIDRNHIDYEVTVEDPKVFVRPWKMSMPLYRRLEKNVQLLEYVCQVYLN